MEESAEPAAKRVKIEGGGGAPAAVLGGEGPPKDPKGVELLLLETCKRHEQWMCPHTQLNMVCCPAACYHLSSRRIFCPWSFAVALYRRSFVQLAAPCTLSSSRFSLQSKSRADPCLYRRRQKAMNSRV
jgi:hypothetical protein